MKPACRFLAAVLCLLVSGLQTLMAWNATGHRAITFLAYSNLSQRARSRAAAILSAHPDYRSILSRSNSSDPTDIARDAFLTASVWPDTIKSDSRFVDTPTTGLPPLPGFPDMSRHQNWHYINLPYPAEFSSQPLEAVNAVTELTRLLRPLRKDGAVSAEEAYALPWILHLVTDLHQPLHTVARFRRVNNRIESDRGGNSCYLAEERNLHALWDSILGTEAGDGTVARLAASIGDHWPSPKKLDLHPEGWAREGLIVAASSVYAFEASCADRDRPAHLTAAYRLSARHVAVERAALSAYRLAEILNSKFGR